MKVYVHDLHMGRMPDMEYDFWYVERLVHQSFLASSKLTSDCEQAGYALIPVYPMMYFAAQAYRWNIDLARPNRWQRWFLNASLNRAFARVVKKVQASRAWRRGIPHVMVFGQGRGANNGYLWQFYRSFLERCILLCVEARPLGDASAFQPHKDLVIPGYTPWQELIDEVRKVECGRDLLLHFRGRCWGPVRPYLPNLVSDDVIMERERAYRLGGEARIALADDARTYFGELRRSWFSLCPAGWTPWSRRFYEALLVGSIPVMIPGDFVPPFLDQINYADFCVTIGMAELPNLESILRRIPVEQRLAMLKAAEEVRASFTYGDSAGAWAQIERSLEARIRSMQVEKVKPCFSP